MESHENAKLTSAELSQIWASYESDTLTVCMVRYFLGHVQDSDIRNLLKHTLTIAQKHVQRLTAIFVKEKIPVPVGFTEDDVNVDAPPLFSDTFMLFNLQQIGTMGMNAHSVSTALSSRKDLHDYFFNCLVEYGKLHEMANDLLLSKGLMVRPPNIPYPTEVEFVKKHSFLSGWFGEHRPLVSLEITNLHFNIQRNTLGMATLMGFSQVTRTKNVTQFMIKGRDIATKHAEIFGSVLSKDNVPSPGTWDTEVTRSTVAPFSEKMMVSITTTLIALGMGYYGTSMAGSVRSDLQTHYVRLSAEIAKYAKEGADIMIENGWMETPPQAPDRDEIAKQ